MEEELIKEIMKIFECDKSYAHKIRISIKEDLPIQGSKPSQMFAIQNFISSKQDVIKSVCEKCRFKSECRFKEMNTKQNCRYFIDEQTVL